jgi:hypothetical protein
MKEYVKPVVIGGMILFAIAAAMYATGAFAGTATVSWTHPTQRVNGAALAVTEIASTRVEFSLGTTFGAVTGTQAVAAPATTLTIGGLTDGQTYCFRAFSVAVDGGISAASVNQPCKVTPTSPPNPPVLTTITSVAYELRQSWFWERLVRVGTVELGQACGAQWKPGYAGLTRDQVTLGRGYRGGALMGRCA